ncbi:MAG: alpha/beta hydrolase [Clostridiales bacterium]|nr:alpha/beta hydrolase [Clostridiales bacterium]
MAAQPWYIAGHSMGGGVVSAMALQDPARTRGLVLIDAALFHPVRGGFLMQVSPLRQWLQVALEHALLNNEGIFRNLLASAYGMDPTDEQVAGYLAPLRLPGTARSLASIMDGARQADPLRYEGLSVPILAIWGEKDTWVPVSELERIKALQPNIAAHIIKGAAHCPMETHTQAFADILFAWLALQ